MLHFRGGFSEEAPPPDVPTTGPLLGHQWVRDNAKPRYAQVTAPPGSTTVAEGPLTQTLFTNATTPLWLPPGSYSVTLPGADPIYPKANQLIVAAIGPSRTTADTAIINGNGSFFGLGFKSDTSNPNVTVRGGSWQNFGVAGTDTTVRWHRPLHVGDGWVIEDAEVAWNQQQGIGHSSYGVGTGEIVRYCHIHDNGRYGVTGSYDAFEHNEVTGNNAAHYDVGDDAGGTKFQYDNGGYYRYNYFHDNYGFQFWHDTGSYGSHVEENVFDGTSGYWGANDLRAIFWEHNGYCTIHRNWIMTPRGVHGSDMFGAAIRLDDCDGTQYGSGGILDISSNYINAYGQAAMGIINTSTAGRPTPRNNQFQDNEVWMYTTHTEWVGGISNDSNESVNWFAPSYGHTFQGNAYRVTDTALAKWSWANASAPYTGAAKTWAQWQAYGFDTYGTIEAI